MSVDVVVCSYRSASDLDAFCRSFEKYAGAVPATLHVANVAPLTEDLVVGRTWAERLQGTHRTFQDNVGYARAVNQTARDGEAEFIAVFNADTRLFEGTLDLCIGALKANDDWGILGPRQINEFGRVTHGGIFGTNEAPVMRGWQQPDGEHLADVAEAVVVAGSAMFIKRKVWNELTDCGVYQEIAPGASGALLPTFHYYEETWMAYHARAHGWKVVYFGPAVMAHHWHKASPVGGWADQQVGVAQAFFRQACQHHGIAHN